MQTTEVVARPDNGRPVHRGLPEETVRGVLHVIKALLFTVFRPPGPQQAHLHEKNNPWSSVTGKGSLRYHLLHQQGRDAYVQVARVVITP